MNSHRSQWICGAAEADITPSGSVFLFGYPHVERTSIGVHDPLRSSAIYLSDGHTAAIFVANDIIWVPRPIAQSARRRISHATGIPVHHIMVTATHTHSGPATTRMLSNASDPAVPPPDPEYLTHLEDAIVAAAVDAHCAARPASVAMASADMEGLGTNRHDPSGAAIADLPILIARDANNNRLLAIMCVCSMHPTVLHEDWRQISGDFPGLARTHLNRNGLYCPFVYHMGAAGDQSPRHVVCGNTIKEADRLSRLLADKVLAVLDTAAPIEPTGIYCQSRLVDLPIRRMPTPAEAVAAESAARRVLADLKSSGASLARIRTAECDVFGAEETVTLARAAADGQLEQTARQCLPAEVQIISIGNHAWIGWPGEVFAEFALAILREFDDVSINTLANGELEGYLVTQSAVAAGTYEAGNALFQSPDSGQMLVNVTRQLLHERHP